MSTIVAMRNGVLWAMLGCAVSLNQLVLVLTQLLISYVFEAHLPISWKARIDLPPNLPMVLPGFSCLRLLTVSEYWRGVENEAEVSVRREGPPYGRMWICLPSSGRYSRGVRRLFAPSS